VEGKKKKITLTWPSKNPGGIRVWHLGDSLRSGPVKRFLTKRKKSFGENAYPASYGRGEGRETVAAKIKSSSAKA